LKPKFYEAFLAIRTEDPTDLGFDHLDLSNPDLRNESIDSVEAGYFGSLLDNRLTLRLDFSYNWYRDGVYFYLDEDEIEYISIGPVRIPDIQGPGLGTENQESGINGHTLELQVATKPLRHTRVFLNVGYRQLFTSERNRFVNREPVWRISAGADVGAGGWTASIRAFYSSSYRSDVREPRNIFTTRISEILPEYFLLNARVSFQLPTDPFKMTAGIEAFNILGARFCELKGLPDPNGPDYSAERFGRRILLFFEGRI
jgi:outer membrane receptor protein involved in Fe transport